MRKFLALALALMMVLALAACGEKTPSGSGTNTPSQSTDGSGTGDVDIDAILSGKGDTVYGSLDAAQKQAMIDAAKAEGAEITFNADGSTTIKDKDGAIMKQNPDGTWTYKDADGGEGQVGGNWPDNEYTKLIPKPDFTITAAVVEGNTFTVMFSDTTKEQITAYVEKVKNAGFTVDAETEDQEMGGIAIYSYTASNSSGYQIEITLSGGMCGLTLEK